MRPALAAIAAATGRESDTFRATLLPAHEVDDVAPWEPLCGPTFAAGVEAIYEGYLVHHGRPRLFAHDGDDDAPLLLGDFLYARGLAWVAELRDVEAVAALAELIALAVTLRLRPDGPDDGPLWAATALFLADRSRGPAFAAARAALRKGDEAPLAASLAQDDVADALAAHRARRSAAGEAAAP